MHEDHDESGTKPLPWALIGFVLLSTYLAGFITGVISDGTVELVNDFNRKHPVVRLVQREDASPTSQATAPALASKQPVVPKPNGQIDWAIAVAPGTPIAPLDVTALKIEQPYRVRFYSVQRGMAPAPVATLWLEGGSKATISLPAGLYKVGGTRLGGEIAWDERAGDETIMKRPLAVRILDPDETTPSLQVGKDGQLSSTAMLASAPKPKPAPRGTGRNIGKAEYEGLGAAAKNGGTNTYGSEQTPGE
jgi:hypothetical protein